MDAEEQLQVTPFFRVHSCRPSNFIWPSVKIASLNGFYVNMARDSGAVGDMSSGETNHVSLSCTPKDKYGLSCRRKVIG